MKIVSFYEGFEFVFNVFQKHKNCVISDNQRRIKKI